MPTYTLEFERPILELQAKIQELRQVAQAGQVDFSSEIARLERKVARLQEEVFANPIRQGPSVSALRNSECAKTERL